MSVIYISGWLNNVIYSFNLRSLDSGKTFTEMYTDPNDGTVVFEGYACNSTGQIVYAIDNPNNKAYKSTDYGASWVLILGVTFFGNYIECSSDGVFVTCSGYWSRDSGATWSQSGMGNSFQNNYNMRMLDDGGFLVPNSYINPTSLYQGYYDAVDIRYRYNTIALPSVTLGLNSMECSTDGQYIYLMSLSNGASDNPSVQGAFVRSLDGGVTFEVFLDVKFKSFPRTMSCSSDGSVIMYSNRYQSMYRSMDYGTSWSLNEEWTTPTPDLYGAPLRTVETKTAPDGSSKYILKHDMLMRVYS
jgi:photosystem II stability/assembly factor-like uncharacterized protein